MINVKREFLRAAARHSNVESGAPPPPDIGLSSGHPAATKAFPMRLDRRTMHL
jgi:hypothetical protein